MVGAKRSGNVEEVELGGLQCVVEDWNSGSRTFVRWLWRDLCRLQIIGV